MRLTRCYPTIVNGDILHNFYQQQENHHQPSSPPPPAMFVANHCSWMDIPFLGATIGWKNYKLISKKELGKVPILGTAIRVGGNIMIDRTDRRSQLATLKQGIGYLKVKRNSSTKSDVVYNHMYVFLEGKNHPPHPGAQFIAQSFLLQLRSRMEFISVPSPKEHDLVMVVS
jgi:1-acyl-sn-glycerol-3-phosphate acyltransferase